MSALPIWLGGPCDSPRRAESSGTKCMSVAHLWDEIVSGSHCTPSCSGFKMHLSGIPPALHITIVRDLTQNSYALSYTAVRILFFLFSELM